MSKRKEGAGGAERERGRGREEKRDFFSSCKPFQLCSGLRTETGRERRKGVHTSVRELEKKEEERGMRATLFQTKHRDGSRMNPVRQKRRVCW